MEKLLMEAAENVPTQVKPTAVTAKTTAATEPNGIVENTEPDATGSTGAKKPAPEGNAPKLKG